MVSDFNESETVSVAKSNSSSSESPFYTSPNSGQIKIILYQSQSAVFSGEVYKASIEIVPASEVLVEYITVQLYGLAFNAAISLDNALRNEKEDVSSYFKLLNDSHIEEPDCKVLFISDLCIVASNLKLQETDKRPFYGFEMRVPPFLPPSFHGESTRYSYYLSVMVSKRTPTSISNAALTTSPVRLRIPVHVMGPRRADMPLLPTLAPVILPSATIAKSGRRIESMRMRANAKSTILSFPFSCHSWQGGSLYFQSSTLSDASISKALVASEGSTLSPIEVSLVLWNTSSSYRHAGNQAVDALLRSSKLPYTYTSIRDAEKQHDKLKSGKRAEGIISETEITLNLFESDEETFSNSEDLNSFEEPLDQKDDAYVGKQEHRQNPIPLDSPRITLSAYDTHGRSDQEHARAATQLNGGTTTHISAPMRVSPADKVHLSEPETFYSHKLLKQESPHFPFPKSARSTYSARSSHSAHTQIVTFPEALYAGKNWNQRRSSAADFPNMTLLPKRLPKKEKRYRRVASNKGFDDIEEYELYIPHSEKSQIYLRDRLLCALQVAGRHHKIDVYIAENCINEIDVYVPFKMKNCLSFIAGSSIHVTLDFSNCKTWTYEVHTFLIRKEEAVLPQGGVDNTQAEAKKMFSEKEGGAVYRKVLWSHRECVINQERTSLIVLVPTSACPSFTTDIVEVSYELLFHFYCVESGDNALERLEGLLNKSRSIIQLPWKKDIDILVSPVLVGTTPLFDGISESDTNIYAGLEEDEEREMARHIMCQKDNTLPYEAYNTIGNMDLLGEGKRRMERSFLV